MEKVRTIKLFRNYYKEFYVAQTDDVRRKINQVLKKSSVQKRLKKNILKVKRKENNNEGRKETGNNELHDP